MSRCPLRLSGLISKMRAARASASASSPLSRRAAQRSMSTPSWELGRMAKAAFSMMALAEMGLVMKLSAPTSWARMISSREVSLLTTMILTLSA